MRDIYVSEKYGVNPMIPKCYLCLEDKNEILLLGRLPGDAEAPKNTVLNCEPCDKCKKFMKQGIILISVRDDQESELESANQERRMPNPHRTGGWWVVKDDFIEQIVQPKELVDFILKKRMCFLPDAVVKKLGIDKVKPTGAES